MDATTLTSFTDDLVDDLTESGRLADLLAAPRVALDDAEVLAVMVEALRLRNVADYLLSRTVVAAERLAIPARKHLKNGANLLTAIGMAPAAAYRAARVGHAEPALTAVTRALRDGALSIEFADAVGKGLEHIARRTDLDDEQRAGIVTTLLIQTTPAEVADRAREIAITLAPTADDDPETVPVAENYGLNQMTIHQGDDGRIAATLDLDVVTGEELHAALDPLCRPVPDADGSPDPRSSQQRRADAFGQVIRSYLAGPERPTSGGVLPHVTLIRAADTDIDRLGYTGPLTLDTADLIACDCAQSENLVDDDGAPLDVGRTQRLFPAKIRRALECRDRGCAFPGCGRPASWCDAHHMTGWADGGGTSVDNGVLLCRMHHTLIHHTGWEVFLGPDRHPWFREPLDPDHPEHRREPLRSHGRRTLTALPHAA